jgi:hypothetical protein
MFSYLAVISSNILNCFQLLSVDSHLVLFFFKEVSSILLHKMDENEVVQIKGHFETDIISLIQNIYIFFFVQKNGPNNVKCNMYKVTK